MTTLKEDLERVATVIRGITKHDVEVVDEVPAVYVNFAYREALVVESQWDQFGKRWAVTAAAWDQTGGLDSEMELGVVQMEYLPGMVKTFLDGQDEQTRKLEELLASRPEE